MRTTTRDVEDWIFSRIGLGVLDKDKVNVVIHGHVPLVAEKIVQLSEDRELLDKAYSYGAAGINIVGQSSNIYILLVTYSTIKCNYAC